MKILVTGGCGFLGFHICAYYRKRGEQVVSFDNLTKYELMRTGYNIEGARLYNWNILKELGVSLLKADIRDMQLLLRAAEGCDYIIHTAAQPAMTISIEEAELDLTTNVIGTFNVLEAAKRHSIPLANCSTIHVYGNKINEGLEETETKFLRRPATIDEDFLPLQGELTPLHASKRSAEIYVQTYIDTYGLEAATFRLSGMYGPNQFGAEDHGWMANFVIRTLLGLPIKVFGSDKQVRDILYVSDAVEAFDAFYKNRKPGIYNIGGGENNIISLGECLQIIKEITGRKQKIILEPKRAGDLWYFACNIDRARSQLNWQPQVPNKEGLKRLIDWVKENLEIFGREER